MAMKLCSWCYQPGTRDCACDDREYLSEYQFGIAVPHLLFCECRCLQRPNMSYVKLEELDEQQLNWAKKCVNDNDY